MIKHNRKKILFVLLFLVYTPAYPLRPVIARGGTLLSALLSAAMTGKFGFTPAEVLSQVEVHTIPLVASALAGTGFTVWVHRKLNSFTPHGRHDRAQGLVDGIEGLLMSTEIKDPEELKAKIKKAYVHKDWPVMGAMEHVKWERNEAIEALGLYEKARDEVASGDSLHRRCTEGMQACNKLINTADDNLILIRGLKCYYDRLERYQRVQAEQSRAQAAQDQADAASSLATAHWVQAFTRK